MDRLSKNVLKLFFVVAVYSVGANAQSQSTSPDTPSFIPALLGDGPRALYNRLDFPNIDGDVDAMVRCIARVGESGTMQGPVCFERDENNSPFFREVMQAATGAELIPAKVDGANVFVDMFQFTVRFQKLGDIENIVVYPHHRRNFQFFGDSYIAAQRYGVHERANCDARTDRFGDLDVRMVFSVDAAGVVGEEIEAMDSTFEDCIIAFRSYIATASYIPAFYEGRPAESVVVQWFTKRQ